MIVFDAFMSEWIFKYELWMSSRKHQSGDGKLQ